MLVLTPFMAKSVWKARNTIKPYLPKIAFLAFLGMVLNQSLGYFAAETTTATNMALIVSLVPLISMFISVPLLNKRLTPLAIVGAILSLAGLVLMLSHGDLNQLLAQGINKGDMLVLIAAFVYALYCVLLKRWDLPLSNWQSVYSQGVLAVIMLTPMLLTSERMTITPEALPLIMYAAIPASVIAPWCWLQGIQRLGADSTAMFMNLMPMMTAVIASIALGEQLAIYHYVGGLMVLSGVAMAQRKRAETKPIELATA